MSTTKQRSGDVKAKALKLISDLPVSSTWDDLMYQIYVRQKIEAGLNDFREGRVHSHVEIRKEFEMS
jgi:hypothetical protein